MGITDQLKFAKEGENISAEQWNVLVRIAKGLASGPDVYQDAYGIYRRRIIPATQAEIRFGIILRVRNKQGHDDLTGPYESTPIHTYSGVYIDNLTEEFTDLVTAQSKDPNTRYWWHEEGSLVAILKYIHPALKSAGTTRRLTQDDLVIDTEKVGVEKTVIITPEAEYSTGEVCD